MQTPRGLNAAGRKLWEIGTSDDYEFGPHELVILEEAARARDCVVMLDRLVETDGMMLKSSQGMRLHPAIAEARQQRLTLARLLVSLGIPPLAEDDLPPTRGLRPFYKKGAR
jgi:hypothetical protein